MNYRAFINQMVFPIARHWVNSDVAKQSLKDNLIVFKNGIFPHLFLWTMTPLVTLQRNIYDVAEEDANDASKRAFWRDIDRFGRTEVGGGILDRVIAYGFTGSSKVLNRALGTHLHYGLALQGGGMPSFNKEVVSIPKMDHYGARRIPDLMMELWPQDSTGLPLTASSRTLELTYGEQMQNVRAITITAVSSNRVSG